jgi:hypothetical protein
MHPRLVALCLSSVVMACSSGPRSADESNRDPSSEPIAGRGLDPSLDTPRELPEDAGAEPSAAESRTQTDGEGQGMPSATTTAPSGPCRSLVVVADNGTFLGEASSKPYEADGVCNSYSSYGSPYGQFSIFNEAGIYGNEVSATSAFNELGSKPPHLYCEGTNELLNPITKNEFLPGAIDPDALCQTLAANGY